LYKAIYAHDVFICTVLAGAIALACTVFALIDVAKMRWKFFYSSWNILALVLCKFYTWLTVARANDKVIDILGNCRMWHRRLHTNYQQLCNKRYWKISLKECWRFVRIARDLL